MEMMKKVNQLIQNRLFLNTMEQLEQLEQNREFCRHGWEHCMDVARGMALINEERSLGYDKEMLYALALVHDLGRVAEYVDGVPHEQAGAKLAQELLSKCGFGDEEVRMMVEAIESHRDTHTAGNALTDVLKEADKKTRLCFCCKAIGKCKWSEEKKNMTILL